MVDLSKMQSDPLAFRRELRIETDTGLRPLATVLDGWQRSDFTALDAGWRRVAGLSANGGPLRGWLERPRGHSKTSDIAAMVSWVLFASRRKLAGVVAAADKDQASLIRDAVDRLVRGNPWLGKLLDVGRDKITNRHTGSAMDVISSDAASSYGLTPDFVVADEVSHWSKRDLWDSLLSASAKKSNCLLLCITNAGFETSWVWPLREAVRVDPDWYFSRLDGPKASWISAARLDEQRRLLPSIAFSRLWLNEWSSGSGDALEPSDIDAAVTLSGPARGPEKGWSYVAGLDLGLTRDASALCVIGKHTGHYEDIATVDEPPLTGTMAALVDAGVVDKPLTLEREREYIAGDGRLKLIDLLICRPTPGNVGSRAIDLGLIELAILELHARFRLSLVSCDPWQAALLIQRLSARGVPIEGTDFTSGNLKGMCSATLDAFTQRQIALYPDASLMADLRALRVVEKNYGVRLESPRSTTGNGTRHGDSATALSLGLHAARRVSTGDHCRVSGPLALWP